MRVRVPTGTSFAAFSVGILTFRNSEQNTFPVALPTIPQYIETLSPRAIHADRKSSIAGPSECGGLPAMGHRTDSNSVSLCALSGAQVSKPTKGTPHAEKTQSRFLSATLQRTRLPGGSPHPRSFPIHGHAQR